MTTPETGGNKRFIDDMSWMERVNLIRALSLFPAITVMVFFRRRLGFRLMRPTWLIVLTVIMVVASVAAPAFMHPFVFLMPVYAVAMLGLGYWQRWQRWCELCRGERWHTYSPGISYFETLPLPVVLRSHRRINRWLDPAAVLVAGALVAVLLSHGLGVWIMFSAFFLYVYENDIYEKQVNRDLDTLDGLFASEVQSEVVERFVDGKVADAAPQPIQETAGIPTGLAPDIARQVAIRRAKRKPAPDNLAPEAAQPAS
jgi:hypothetical protein